MSTISWPDLEQLEEMSPFLTIVGVGDVGCHAIKLLEKRQVAGIHLICANTSDWLQKQGVKGVEIPSFEKMRDENTDLNTTPKSWTEQEKGVYQAIQTQLAKKEAVFFVNPISESELLVILADLSDPICRNTVSVFVNMDRKEKKYALSVAILGVPAEGGDEIHIVDSFVEEIRQSFDSIFRIPFTYEYSNASDKIIPSFSDKEISEYMARTVQAITDPIATEGLICVDYADVRTVLNGMGMAVMGIATARGSDRARLAARCAITSPQLGGVTVGDAKGILINITGGYDLKLQEIDAASTLIRDSAKDSAEIVLAGILEEQLGSDMDDSSMKNEIRVTVLLSGIDTAE